MIGLTRRQADALRFIVGYIEAHGRAPFYREIGEGIGVASNCTVHRLISALEERGRISRVPLAVASVSISEPVSIPRTPDGSPLYFVQVGARHG